MVDVSRIDYSFLDRPEVLGLVFHPRPDYGGSRAPSAQDLSIPVEEGVTVGARFHMGEKESPNILFFHGNGEIVSDYDEFGSLYNRIGVNFMPVDYRGYGRSTGEPTVTAMMCDSHTILDFVLKWLQENGYTGPMVVMGRSLGSASALELAARHKNRLGGLVIESGFAYAGPLMRLLGIDVDRLGFTEEKGFGNLDKIRTFRGPTLIIHAERDHIIPFSDGQALYEASGAEDKSLLKIPNANHNDIFLHGLPEYMQAVKTLTEKAK